MAEPTEPGSIRRPQVLLFDVNETLSNMAPLAERFGDVGAPPHLARTWFAALLRDGFALTVAGTNPPFAELAAEVLRNTLEGLALDRPVEEAASHVLGGFSELAVHRDVPQGLRRLADHGLRLVTLSNGSSSIARGLLGGAGLDDVIERFLSVEEAGIWKPAAGAYEYALSTCGVEPSDAMLVAAHPWDTDGAQRAGLASAWVNRTGSRFPAYFRAPGLEVASLEQLADELR